MIHFRSANRFMLTLTLLVGGIACADMIVAAPPPPRIVSQVAKLDITGLQGRPTAVTAMAASEASGLICIGTQDDRLHLIDVKTLKIVAQTAGHRDRIRSVCFSPDGQQVVSVGNDGRLQVWKISSAGLNRAISTSEVRPATTISRTQTMDRTPALARVAFSPSGENIIAVGFTKKIYVLGRNGNPSGRLACSNMDLRAVTHDSQGRLIVAGQGGAVHVYSDDQMIPVGINTSASRLHDHDHEICRCQTNPGSINDVASLPGNGRIVCVCDEGIVSQYDSAGNEVDGRVGISKGRLFAVEPLNSHTVAVAGSDDTIRIVDLAERRITESLVGHRGSIVDLAIVDGKLISAGFDATIRVWRPSAIVTSEEPESKVAQRPSTPLSKSPQRSGL